MSDNKEKKQKKTIAGSKVPVINVIIVAVLLFALLGTSIFGIVVFSARPYDQKDGKVDVYKLQSQLYTKAIVAAMSDSIEGNDNGRKVKFYIEVNDKYDSKKDEPINQYRVYYYDLEGNKQVCVDGIYHGTTEDMYPLVGFFIDSMNSLKTMKKIITAVMVIAIIAIVALAGYMLYLLWAVKEDRKYSPSYQAMKRQKKLDNN